MSANATAAPRPGQRMLVNGIFGMTARIAAGIGAGQWGGIPLLAARRRLLLSRLAAQCADRESSWLQAITAAVAESDQALALMAAAATASASADGARPVRTA